MKHNIVGFHLDEHGDWVADLMCGHGQHVRHRPPLSVRVWATTEEGRQGRLGSELNCLRCEEAGRPRRQALANLRMTRSD